MNISIHQPDYIPYLGYFYKMYSSDIFVFLDDVQFSNSNMHNWNKIKTPQGECRLKIPVKYSFGDKISEVKTRDDLDWKVKHLKTIEMYYSKSEKFKEIFPRYNDIVMINYSNLSELNIALNKFICSGFGFNTKFELSSKLNLKSSKEDKVIDICIALGGDTYISGLGAKAYQSNENFTKRGINLKYTDFKVFDYPQQWGEFIPNLSIIDYVFNCGFSNPFIKNENIGSYNG